MKLFEKYTVNGDFTNYSLESMLKDLNVEQSLINQIIIRYSTSNLTKEFIEQLKKLKEDENPINLILQFFLIADKMKPITCDKKLSQNLQV